MAVRHEEGGCETGRDICVTSALEIAEEVEARTVVSSGAAYVLVDSQGSSPRHCTRLTHPGALLGPLKGAFAGV